VKPVLHLLTGPTAVGKTEWALQWAERNGAEIVSADSLLFYRGMDIGTAKPTAAELARVPHHLIDICDVRERMDVTTYLAKARAAVDAIVARGRAVLVTGGSGFYLKSFLAPVSDDVDVPESIRADVASLLLEQAVERLRSLNAGELGTLDVANPRRVTRALERCLASGLTLKVKAKKATTAAMPTATRNTKDPGRPAPPGMTCLSLSWLRFSSSSRSG
jgi:tRNA dimethylallyltransferase